MASPNHTMFFQLELFLDLEHEEWRPIPGWEGSYEASSWGRVRSVDRCLPYGRPLRQRLVKGVILKQQPYGRLKNYRLVGLRRNQQRIPRPIHQLVLETFIGPCPSGYITNHLDGNPGNNRLSNLERCTYSQNNLHALDMGLRGGRGERHFHSRFTNADIVEIRHLHRQGVKQHSIAARYGCSQSTISAIVRYVAWKHVP